MLKKIKTYLQNTVLPTDLIRGKFKSKNKLRIGWCGVFPPFDNGAAAVSYYFVNELIKNQDIEIFAIPFNHKITKFLFKNIKITTIKDKKLDCIILWCLGDHLPTILKRTKVPTIAWQTVHKLPQEDECEQKLLDQLKQINHVITMTKWAKKIYQKYIPNIEYIPFGVDTNLFQPTDKEKIEVLFVSRIHYYKGVMPFLETIPFVLKKNSKIIFRVQAPLDKNSPYLDEIQSLIKKTKIKYPNNFFYDLNWIDYGKIPKIYKQSSILVFPSTNEGFGVPLVEAMACEVVCISADKPPMNEIIDNSKTGFCIPYRKGIEKNYHGFQFPHPRDLAKKINYLIDNKKKLKQMGKRAREKALKEYSLEKCAEKMVSLIKFKVGQ